MIKEIIIFLISFLGVVSGFVMAHFTKEELKPGKKYFEILKKILLIIIAFIVIYENISFSLEILIPFFFGILAGYIVKKEYLYFGIILKSNLYVLGSLIFIYGLPAGTKHYMKKKKEKIIFDGLLFAIGGLVAYFTSFSMLTVFSAGALLSLSIIKAQR